MLRTEYIKILLLKTLDSEGSFIYLEEPLQQISFSNEIVFNLDFPFLFIQITKDKSQRILRKIDSSSFDYKTFRFHFVKSVRIRSYSGPHFPAFGLNMERYSVFSPNVGKCGLE